MKEKYCGKCDTVKDAEEFNKNSKKKDGLNSICKSCHSAYRKEYYKKNKEKEISQVRKYQKSHPRKYKNRKKAGRTYKGVCKLEGCNNIAFLTKRDLKDGRTRFCSPECSHKYYEISCFEYQFNNIKKSVIKRNKDFDISLKYIEDLFYEQGEKCAITNVPLEVNKSTKSSSKTRLFKTASLDRIDSSKGYIKGNVQWVMLGINYMKRNFPEKDLHKALQLIIENYTGTNS